MNTLFKSGLLFITIFSSLLFMTQKTEGQMYLNTIQYNTNALQADWDDWRNKYVTTRDAGDAPRMRVLNGVNSSTTYSEGQAYGLLFAATFDDQTLFDGLFLYARDYFNDHGLMDWKIQGTSIIGYGAATDADLDMAMALLFACDKVQTGAWSASAYGLNYCDEAQAMIQAIWDYEIDHPDNTPPAGLNNNQGYELIPGDYWNLSQDYPNGITNLSYFSPAYFRLFAEFTNNDDWYQVINRGYEIASLAANNSCAGFVSNWNTYSGTPQVVPWQGYTSEYWGWDAARFAWRVGLDVYWFDDTAAQNAISPIGNFFASLGINNVRAQYNLDGTTVNSYRNIFFISNAAVSIWATPSLQATSCGDASGSLLSNAQQAYTEVVQNKDHTYYADSWRLLTLVLMSGRFELPFENSASPNATQAPTQMPTPVVTEEVTPEAPTILPIASQNNTAGDSVSLPIEANSNAVALTYSAMNLPLGLSIDPNTGTISGTLSAQSVGEQTVTITMTDNLGQTAQQSFQWIVDPNSSQEVTVASSHISLELWGAQDTNSQAQFRVRLTSNGTDVQAGISWRLYFTVEPNYTAADYRLDTYWDSSRAITVSDPIQYRDNIYYYDLSYNSSLAPNAEWIFQGSLHLNNWQADMDSNNDWWKQGGFAESYQATPTIPIYVNNALISGAEPGQTIPVTAPTSTPVPVAAAPTIAPISNQTSTVGNSASLTIVASTSTAHPLIYSATGLPTGLSINRNSGVISGTISGNARQYTISVTVSDVNNRSTSRTFTWTVNASNNSGNTNNNQNNNDSNPTSNNLRIEILGSTDSNNQAQFRVRLTNNGTNAQAGISWRLYFTVDEGYNASDYRLDTYWDSLGSAQVSAPIHVSGNVYYFNVVSNSAIATNAQWVFQGSIHLANWQNINTNNDWWKQGGFAPSYQATTSIPVYRNGTLIIGSQPS